MALPSRPTKAPRTPSSAAAAPSATRCTWSTCSPPSWLLNGGPAGNAARHHRRAQPARPERGLLRVPAGATSTRSTATTSSTRTHLFAGIPDGQSADRRHHRLRRPRRRHDHRQRGRRPPRRRLRQRHHHRRARQDHIYGDSGINVDVITPRAHGRAGGRQFRCVQPRSAVRRQRPDLRRRAGLDGDRRVRRLQRRDLRRPRRCAAGTYPGARDTTKPDLALVPQAHRDHAAGAHGRQPVAAERRATTPSTAMAATTS